MTKQGKMCLLVINYFLTKKLPNINRLQLRSYNHRIIKLRITRTIKLGPQTKINSFVSINSKLFKKLSPISTWYLIKPICTLAQ